MKQSWCKKTMAERKIIHMFIENYKIDNSYYSNLPKTNLQKLFSDISFLCLLLFNTKFREYFKTPNFCN